MASEQSTPAYELANTEGTMVSYFGALATIKANSELADGSFGVTEYWAREGHASPWHIHLTADEMFYILEGEVTGYTRNENGEETSTTITTGGTFYIPKGLDHTFKVASEEAKMLTLFSPPHFEEWFVELGDPVETYELPQPDAPDEAEENANAITPELCERYDVEITGPPPV